MYLYRLVYILATKNGGGWEQIDDSSVSGEFKNRAAAKDFVERNKDNGMKMFIFSVRRYLISMIKRYLILIRNSI
jgi:hypothetical protein